MHSLFDVIGLLGSACIVGTYALSQSGRMSTDRVAYPALNALGAGLLLVSLSVDFNLAASMIEAFWLLISLYGVVRNTTAASRNLAP